MATPRVLERERFGAHRNRRNVADTTAVEPTASPRASKDAGFDVEVIRTADWARRYRCRVAGARAALPRCAVFQKLRTSCASGRGTSFRGSGGNIRLHVAVVRKEWTRRRSILPLVITGLPCHAGGAHGGRSDRAILRDPPRSGACNASRIRRRAEVREGGWRRRDRLPSGAGTTSPLLDLHERICARHRAAGIALRRHLRLRRSCMLS